MPSSRTSAGELLFLDTSVLVRLYYLERDDPFAWAVDLAQRPDVLLAASHLAYVETLAAFHALRRGRAITSRRQASLSAAFRADWPSFLRVPLSPPRGPTRRRLGRGASPERGGRPPARLLRLALGERGEGAFLRPGPQAPPGGPWTGAHRARPRF